MVMDLLLQRGSDYDISDELSGGLSIAMYVMYTCDAATQIQVLSHIACASGHGWLLSHTELYGNDLLYHAERSNSTETKKWLLGK